MDIDSTGHAWFPRAGDAVKDCESDCYGVVLEVRQTANAPAWVHVAIVDNNRNWSVVEREPHTLSRDDRDDGELPSFAERRAAMSLDEAHSCVFNALEELASYRRRVDSEDALAGVLEVEAARSLTLASTYADRHRYDLAAHERAHASRLRELACAVAIIVADRPMAG